MATRNLRLGRYKHYSGRIYQVIGVARHSEDLEDYVVYRGLYNSKEFGIRPLWVRPKKMFIETVSLNGKKVPRFKYLGKK